MVLSRLESPGVGRLETEMIRRDGDAESLSL